MWSGLDHDVGVILESTMQRNGEEDINTNIMYNIGKREGCDTEDQRRSTKSRPQTDGNEVIRECRYVLKELKS